MEGDLVSDIIKAALADLHESRLEIGTGQIQKGEGTQIFNAGDLWDVVQSLPQGSRALVVWVEPEPPAPVEVPSVGRFYVVGGKVQQVEEVGGVSFPGANTQVTIEMKEYPR